AAAVTISLSPCLNTDGPVTSSTSGDANQSLIASVFASSETMALALPSPVAARGPIAAKTVPSAANASRPTIGPPLLFHETTGLPSLSRSIAHTAFGALPQVAPVVA